MKVWASSEVCLFKIIKPANQSINMATATQKKVHTVSIEPIWALPDGDLFAHLGADIKQGLSAAEATKRLETFGPNAIVHTKQTPVWKIFLRQFKSPLVVLLVVAAGASFAFQEWLDGTAILVVVLLNALIGFYMEFQAQRSMAALKKNGCYFRQSVSRWQFVGN